MVSRALQVEVMGGVMDAPQRRREIGRYEIDFAHERRRGAVSWQNIAAMLRLNEATLRGVAGEPRDMAIRVAAPASDRVVPPPALVAEPAAEPVREPPPASGPAPRVSEAAVRILAAIAAGERRYKPLARQAGVTQGTVYILISRLRRLGLLTAPHERQFPRITGPGRMVLAQLGAKP